MKYQYSQLQKSSFWYGYARINRIIGAARGSSRLTEEAPKSKMTVLVYVSIYACRHTGIYAYTQVYTKSWMLCEMERAMCADKGGDQRTGW
jgi:hypothetical protein